MKIWISVLVLSPLAALGAPNSCPQLDGIYNDCVQTVKPAELGEQFEIPKTLEVKTQTVNGQTIVTMSRDGEEVDPSNQEATMGNVFRPGAPKFVMPIEDAGIKAIEVTDSCDGARVLKEIRTILDPSKPLEFPIVDADLSLSQEASTGALLVTLNSPNSQDVQVQAVLRCQK